MDLATHKSGESQIVALMNELGIECPPRLEGGHPNPAYYRAQLDAIDILNFQSMKNGEVLKGYDALQRGILKRAELDGIEAKHVIDRRSASDRAADAVERLCATPDAVFEMLDDEIEALEAAMKDAEDHTDAAIESLRVNGHEVPASYREMIDKLGGKKIALKAWRGRLDRIRRLRHMARTPVYRKPRNGDDRLAQESGHLLRYMVYVGRSNAATMKAGRAVFNIAFHHAMMAVNLHLAWTRQELAEGGLVDNPRITGAAIICPPRHGKTEVGVHWLSLRIHENRNLQGIILHAREQEASKTLGYVAATFDPSQPNGRRALALYPGARLAKRDNNARKMRLVTDRVLRQPTLTACGAAAKASGANADIIWADDLCDQETASQETSRADLFDRWNGTWLMRKQTRNAFDLTTATLWHPEDPVSRRIRQQEALGRQNNLRVLIMPCGGPDDSKPFAPLWPSMYPESYLRAKFREMNNPTLYSAAYRCDPVAESARLLKRVRLYDPRSEEHRRFLSAATRHLSLDPSATNKSSSDKAGVVYVARGELVTERVGPDGVERVALSKVRVLDADQIHATQSELVEHVAQFARTNPVDYVHVETRGGYVAVAEMLANKFNIEAVRHDPTNVPKRERFKAALPMIEDANAALGVEPIVELPGVPGDSGLVPDPRYNWFFDQLLRFGFTAQDHGVDALVQLLLYWAPQMGVGLPGSVTRAVKHVDDRARRMQQALAEHQGKPDNNPAVPVEVEDWQWLGGY